MSKCENCKHANQLLFGWVKCGYEHKVLIERETCAAQVLNNWNDTYMRASNYIKDVKGEQK